MASDQDFVDFIVDQLELAGDITYRKMFGEYAINPLVHSIRVRAASGSASVPGFQGR